MLGGKVAEGKSFWYGAALGNRLLGNVNSVALNMSHEGEGVSVRGRKEKGFEVRDGLFGSGPRCIKRGGTIKSA